MELKIFTLNCWGIPFISKDKNSRMQAISEVLSTSKYDVVCLQEVWKDSDFHLIREKSLNNLPYSHYFYSGVVGSGVCILSRYPIQDVFFHKWAVNGYVHKIQHGDWFGGKGVGLCVLRVNGYTVHVYSAHLHAEYNRESDEYQAHRVLQAYDTAQFIQLTSTCADLVVLAGDLNTEPGDLAYRILTNVTGFTDACMETDLDLTDSAAAATNEDPSNSYCSTRPSSSSSSSSSKTTLPPPPPGKRIDYILYRSGGDITTTLLSYGQPLPARVPSCVFSYSDHEAIAASLQLTRRRKRSDGKETMLNNNTTPCQPLLQHLRHTTLLESTSICRQYLDSLVTHRKVYWTATVVLVALLTVTFVTDDPTGGGAFYHVVRGLLTGGICFSVVMATLWNMIERNGVVAGVLAMEVRLSEGEGLIGMVGAECGGFGVNVRESEMIVGRNGGVGVNVGESGIKVVSENGMETEMKIGENGEIKRDNSVKKGEIGVVTVKIGEISGGKLKIKENGELEISGIEREEISVGKIEMGGVGLGKIEMGGISVDKKEMEGISVSKKEMEGTSVDNIEMGKIDMGKIEMGGISKDKIEIDKNIEDIIERERISLGRIGIDVGKIEMGAISEDKIKMGEISVGKIERGDSGYSTVEDNH